ncbi:MAG: hypothetical protein J5564_05025 [Clostridia bacterium]|nr:hypothetical protein [Clostridia bacterium]
MFVRKMKTVAVAVLMLALLAGVFSAAAEGSLKSYQDMDQDLFLSLLREFDPEASLSWGPWEWSAGLMNDMTLYGTLKSDGSMASASCDADPEDKQSLEALKDTLRALFESDQTPEIEQMIDDRAAADLDVFVAKLHLEEGCFTLTYDSDWLPSMTAEELEQFLRDVGLLEGDLDYSRSAALGKEDYRAKIQVDDLGKLESLSLYYYGGDAESGKTFFSRMSGELIDGQELQDTLQLVDGRYDALETGKNAKADFRDFRVTLNRTKKYYRLTYRIKLIPWNAAAFAEGMEGTVAAAGDIPAMDPEAFSGIDISAQIPETVIFQGNGVKVTALELVYGKTDGGVDGIGLKLLVEKDEGVDLNRIAFPVSSVNRWKGEFRFFDKSMYYPTGAAACREETVAWWKLDDLKKQIPAFEGITSFKIGVNLIPPDGAGETVRGEAAELSTGIPESPLPGRTLYSDERLTVNLTGVAEGTDRWYALGIACDNRGDKLTLGVNYNSTRLNDFRFYACDMGIEIPAGMRVQGTMTLDRGALQELGITDLSQVETLKVKLVNFDSADSPLGEVLITREDLGLQDQAEGTAAEPSQETVLYENAGVRLVFTGFSADGRSLDLIMKNGSEDTAILQVQPFSANGWQLNAGGWNYSAKAGENHRQLLPIADFVPDFTELTDVSLRICPCRRNVEYGITEALYDQMQEASLTFAPAAQHEDRGTVLVDHQGVRLLFRGFETNYYGDPVAKMVLINDSGTVIRFSDAHDPLNGTSKARCSINGIEREFYVLFTERTRVDAGLRAETDIHISKNELDSMNLRPDDVKTVDFEWSLFPDADKIDYTRFNVHLE